jgi:hypothetical protein
VNLEDWERSIELLDALLRPIANEPVDLSDRDWAAKMSAAPSPVDRAGVADAAYTVLRAVLTAYADGDEEVRATERGWFERYASFRWAVHLPDPPSTPAGFRLQITHLSARDQVPDTRDELLLLWDLCRDATAAGVDIGPILAEIAAISSDVDRYGFGSTRRILLGAGRHDASRHDAGGSAGPLDTEL